MLLFLSIIIILLLVNEILSLAATDIVSNSVMVSVHFLLHM